MIKSVLISRQTSSNNNDHADRNPDGTFTKGSELAKELGAQGGHASHGGNTHADRNPDGTFTKGSELAKELGAQGGHAAHEAQSTADDGVSIRQLASSNLTNGYIAQPRRHFQGWQQACSRSWCPGRSCRSPAVEPAR
jgi:general stress protein YciG